MRGGRTDRHGLDLGHRRHPCRTRFPALTLVILWAETVQARGVCRSLPLFAVSGAAAFLRLMAPNLAPAMIGAKHRLVLPMSAGLDALLLLADARFRFVDHVAALMGGSLIARGANRNRIGGSAPQCATLMMIVRNDPVTASEP